MSADTNLLPKYLPACSHFRATQLRNQREGLHHPPKFPVRFWQINDSKILGDIEAMQDSPTHVSNLPSATMLLEKYEAALAQTQNEWEKV